MSLKLYGNALSPFTQDIALVLTELRLSFSHISLGWGGEMKSPEHLARNPLGKVPVLDDDGLIIFESRAISRYLVLKHQKQAGVTLVPPQSDLVATAKFETAASLEYSHFTNNALSYLEEKLYKQSGVDEARASAALTALNEKLDVYEFILAKQKYLAGDDVTLADLLHLPLGSALADKLGLDIFKKRQNVSRWWTDLTSRSAWQTVKDGF